MPTYHATIHTTEPRKKYTNLAEASYRHIDPYASNLYTTFKVFVPAPRNGEHLPAILLSVKNGKGDCLLRLTPEAAESLLAALQTAILSPNITNAFNTAKTTISTYSSLEREAFTQAPVY